MGSDCEVVEILLCLVVQDLIASGRNTSKARRYWCYRASGW